MRPFLTFEKASDIRHCHEDFYELVIFVDGTVLDRGENDSVQIIQQGHFYICSRNNTSLRQYAENQILQYIDTSGYH